MLLFILTMCEIFLVNLNFKKIFLVSIINKGVERAALVLIKDSLIYTVSPSATYEHLCTACFRMTESAANKIAHLEKVNSFPPKRFLMC